MDDEVRYEREARSSVLLKATYQTGDTPVQRRVRNLSAHGICVDADGDLAMGMSVRLVIGSVETVGQVVWANSTAAGLHFDEPIDLALARTPRRFDLATKTGWLNERRNPYAARS